LGTGVTSLVVALIAGAIALHLSLRQAMYLNGSEQMSADQAERYRVLSKTCVFLSGMAFLASVAFFCFFFRAKRSGFRDTKSNGKIAA